MTWNDRWRRGGFAFRFLRWYLPMLILLGAAWLILLHRYLNIVGFLVIWLAPAVPVIALFELSVFLARGSRR